jgi:hypothetical protein
MLVGCFSGRFSCVCDSGNDPDMCRCQTCPQAFCEDCLPEDDIDAIGETLPELLVVPFPYSEHLGLISASAL